MDPSKFNVKSMYEKMVTGELYKYAGDSEIQAASLKTMNWLHKFNSTGLSITTDERHELLKERIGTVGTGSDIRPPFHCDYG